MDTGDFKDNKEPPIEVYGGSVEGHSEGVDVTPTTAEPVYRLYKQRFVGLFALVSVAASMEYAILIQILVL